MNRRPTAPTDIDAILSRAKPRPMPARPGLIRECLADLIGCAALFVVLICVAGWAG